ncbi:serine/arginine repetitive matrix protein 3-like [Cervus canadensis]|uniref:serine/arginine repetitive matrix protein 3-like n=1 Tax=Cervus canadensis TaxID=1574408 RepID=UPI001C9E6D66|nr:serine/arginine repetitive matrix protein 3-like [Cervus canadensis]
MWMGTVGTLGICEGVVLVVGETEGVGQGKEGIWWYSGEGHSSRQSFLGHPRPRASPRSPLFGRHPYPHRDSRYTVHTCPPGRKHRCKGQRNKESHEFAPTGTTQSQFCPLTRPSPADCFYRGDPKCAPTPGVGAAFRPESRGASVGVPGSGLPSHKGQDRQGSAPEGRSVRATPPAGSCFLPGEGRRAPISAGRAPSFPARRSRSAQAALRAGRARVRPEPESPLPSPHLSFPRRSTTSTKWQSASPRARGEMRSGRRDGLGGLPHSTAPERGLGGGAAGAGGGWGWARPGPRPPSLALARPGNRAAAGAGSGMRTAASLAVKLTPGEGAGG